MNKEKDHSILQKTFGYASLNISLSAFKVALLISSFLNLLPKAHAQESSVTYQSLDEVVKTAIENNPTLKAANLQTRQERALKGSSWNLPKTDLGLEYGQTNSIYDNDSRLTVSQRFAFPTVYAHQSKLAKARIESSEWHRSATQNELVQQVKSAWYALWLAKSKKQLLQQQDSIFQRFVQAAALRFKTGESNLLEKATAESQAAEIKAMIEQNNADIEILKIKLKTLLNIDQSVEIAVDSLHTRENTILLDTTGITNNPTLAWFRQQTEVAEQEKSVEKSRLMPDITIGYFNQSFNGPGQTRAGDLITYSSGDRFSGFQLGLAIPIFGVKSQFSAIRVAELKKQESSARLTATTNELQGRLQSLIQQYQKFQTSLHYYQKNALPEAELILKQAQKGFESGEIGYVEYVQGLNRALTVRFNYLDILDQYNQTFIQIEFIAGY